jgi:drug/metabolite transporter (DMT)-like permease
MNKTTFFPAQSHARQATGLGIIAILLWSTTIAFSRSLTEQLGTFTAAGLIYILAGLIGLGYAGLRKDTLSKIWKLPKKYLLGCGALFVAYNLLLYLAIGLASSRVQVVLVGLLNYLWPGLSLLFSIPILGRHARASLPLGILLALAGVWLAGGSELTPSVLLSESGGMLPYTLAFGAATCWGLYSNLSRRWAAGSNGDGTPLFLFASGVLLALPLLFTPEVQQWTLRTGIELMYMAVFPGMLAYALYDFAVRNGEIVLVASASYLTPLLSTMVSVLVLNVQPGPFIWLGTGLVITGAVICKFSIAEE